MKEKIKIWCKIYKMVWNFSPKHLIFLSFLGLIEAFSVLIQLFVIQQFINQMQKSDSSVKTLGWSLVLLGSVFIFRKLFNAYFNYNINKHIQWAKDVVQFNFLKDVSKVPLSSFYESDFETRKNMAKKGADSAVYFLIIGLIVLSFNIPYFIFIGGYYMMLSPIMICVLLFIIFPSFYAISKNMKEYQQLEQQISKNRKKIDYYYRCVGDRNYVKETKILQAGNYFFNKVDEETKEYYDFTKTHSKYILQNSLIGENVKYIGYIGILVLLMILVYYNQISIGFFIATITSLNDMYSVFNDMVDRDFKSLSSFYYEVVQYLQFQKEGAKTVNKKEDEEKRLRFHQVSYHYPNHKENVIKDFSFEFEAGKIYAVVGENGAGKTTLSRLLLGLISPSTGEISFPKDENACSALFQKHNKYPFSLRENVFLSNSFEVEKEEKVKQCLMQCGIDMEDKMRFPKGLDTVLSKEFQGIDLSGGQWQRIALARCIYKDYHILLLDEPTSAIDPINESSLFHIFEEISKSKTSIIITHRLGVVKIADCILVLDKGQLVETGTHDELMALGGKYKEMYLAQSKNYFVEGVGV